MFLYKSFTSVPRFQYLQRFSAARLGLSLILAALMVSLLLLFAP